LSELPSPRLGSCVEPCIASARKDKPAARYSLGGAAGVASSGVASAGGGGVPSGGSPLVASIGVPSLGVSYVNGSSGLLGDEDEGRNSDSVIAFPLHDRRNCKTGQHVDYPQAYPTNQRAAQPCAATRCGWQIHLRAAAGAGCRIRDRGPVSP
jgi:hypothetical protein